RRRAGRRAGRGPSRRSRLLRSGVRASILPEAAGGEASVLEDELVLGPGLDVADEELTGGARGEGHLAAVGKDHGAGLAGDGLAVAIDQAERGRGLQGLRHRARLLALALALLGGLS